MRDVVAKLVLRLPGIARERIEYVVASEYEVFEGRPIRQYISILVEHTSKTRLLAEVQQFQAELRPSEPDLALAE